MVLNYSYTTEIHQCLRSRIITKTCVCLRWFAVCGALTDFCGCGGGEVAAEAAEQRRSLASLAEARTKDKIRTRCVTPSPNGQAVAS